MTSRRHILRVAVGAALVQLAACRGWAQEASATVSRGVFQRFVKGSYAAWPGLWYLLLDHNLGLDHAAIEGVDFVSTSTVDPAAFPASTTIDWRVPAVPPPQAGVYGYLHISYGNYDNTIVDVPIPPRQVRDIEVLTAHIDYKFEAGADSASILFEFWLTSLPGDLATKTLEVGFFLHAITATIDYVASSAPLGAYVDPHGREWRAAVASTANAPFVMLVPADGFDVSGVFDVAALFRFLTTLGTLSGAEWFNGLAVGPEPHTGSGRLVFNSFQVDYSSRLAAR